METSKTQKERRWKIMKAISEMLVAVSVALFMVSMILWSWITLVTAFTVLIAGAIGLCAAVSKEEDY
jgi:uncharacterized membrane protein